MASDDPEESRLSESEAEAETNHSQGPESNSVIGLFFGFRFRQSSFHQVICDGVIAESVFCFWLRLFDFHQVLWLHASDYDSDYDFVCSEKQP